jgi:hypothetical protein
VPSCQDVVGGDEGSPAERVAVDAETHLVGDGVGLHFVSTDDSGFGGSDLRSERLQTGPGGLLGRDAK